jgi:hypothetical protein
MTQKHRALIDSGCDATAFPEDFAVELGIDFAQCTPVQGMTASGKDDPTLLPRTWPAGVNAIFEGERLALNALFRPGLPLILLGRKDFFAYFKIQMDQRAQTFRLERYP